MHLSVALRQSGPGPWTLDSGLFCLLLAALVHPLAAAEPRSARDLGKLLEPTRRVIYKSAGSQELHLHLFEPPGHKATDKRPCFLAIHGGGWRGGEPRHFYAFAHHFAQRGMLGVSLEYRLASPARGTQPEDCVRDARSAIRYLRQHAAELGIDPDKIIAAGGSAGGHIAAGTAMFNQLDDPADDTSISCVPNALVLYYPVIDTSAEGYGHDRLKDRWKAISPRHQVRPGLPPTLVFHGTADRTTPFLGAEDFHKKMLAAGNRCELVAHEGGQHGYLVYDLKLLAEALQRTEQFLDSLKE